MSHSQPRHQDRAAHESTGKGRYVRDVPDCPRCGDKYPVRIQPNGDMVCCGCKLKIEPNRLSVIVRKWGEICQSYMALA